MEQRSAFLHGFLHVNHCGENLVVHFDEGQGRLGHVGVDGGNRCDRVALEQRLVAGHHVVGGELEPAIVAAQFFLAERSEGQVFCGYDRLDARKRFGLAGVYGADAGVGVRTAQHLGVKQSVQLYVGPVLGAASDLVHAVGPHRTLADDVVFNFGENLIR